MTVATEAPPPDTAPNLTTLTAKAALSAMPVVTVNGKGERRADAGHPWIYRSDITRLEGIDEKTPGPVAVVSPRGRLLGYAFFNPASEITLRLCVTTGEMEDARDVLTPRWFTGALDAALARRRAFGLLTGPDDLCGARLVHGEGDGLPGIIVDVFGPVVAFQTLNQTAETFKPVLVDWLAALFPGAALVERNDAKVREHEQLPSLKGIVRGTLPAQPVYTEGTIQLGIDALDGQKTGAFLDQRDNRIRTGQLAFGRALDVFSYQGGFALQMARSPSVKSVSALDVSDAACAQIEANAKLNGLAVTAIAANAFDFLREADMDREGYDTIVLDPPAFAKTKASVEKALGGYREINLRALKLLSPGGVLVTCTCSHHVSAAMFEQVVSEAAADARRTVQVIERRGAGPDHPERLNFPEGGYLKALVLRVL